MVCNCMNGCVIRWTTEHIAHGSAHRHVPKVAYIPVYHTYL